MNRAMRNSCNEYSNQKQHAKLRKVLLENKGLDFLCKENLLDFINKNNFNIINLSSSLEFLEDKFLNPNYSYLRTLDIYKVIRNPILKKQVFKDALQL